MRLKKSQRVVGGDMWLMKKLCSITFQMLITDMAANSYMIDDINKLAGVMLDAGHPKKDYVKKRQVRHQRQVSFKFYIIRA